MYRLMATYGDETLDCIPLTLGPGEKEHVVVFQDKSIFHTNKYHRCSWLAQDQQAIRKKGNGWAVHVSDFISKTIGHIRLSEEQIAKQLAQPAELHLPTFEAWKITYPGKGFDVWWDLAQLIEQVEHTLKVFEHTHPDCVGIFIFDRSSAHEGFAENALNVNNMNIKHGGKQRKLRDTVIPLSNPDRASGEDDTRSQVRKMCFPDDHPDPGLRGKPKGIKVVLQERKSIWDKYIKICKERDVKDIRKCAVCSKSETYKDAERCVMFAEAAGEATSSADELTVAGTVMPPTPHNMWCCMQRVLSLQEDFQAERPLIQMLIEDSGHICLFLP